MDDRILAILRDRAESAEARAEKVERERDAAIKELDGVAAAVDDLSDFIDEQIHPLVQYDIYLLEKLAAMCGYRKKGHVVDKLVREKMLMLNGGKHHERNEN